jgi:hypothetical protein
MSRYPTKPAGKKPAGTKKTAPKKQAKQRAREQRTKRETPAAKVNAARTAVEAALAHAKARVDETNAQMQRLLCQLDASARASQLSARAMSAIDFNANLEARRKPLRYRFRDAVTGLFLRARDALRRPRTTVREKV